MWEEGHIAWYRVVMALFSIYIHLYWQQTYATMQLTLHAVNIMHAVKDENAISQLQE